MGLTAAEILERLGTMLRDTHPGMTATVCIAEIHRSGQVRIANAGHMPPVVADRSGCRIIAEHGPLLGLVSNRTVPTTVLPFGPGATLVLFTDGLVERKSEDIEVGLRRLTSCVSANDRDSGGGAEQLCQRVLDDVGAGADTFDDIAIVVARVRPV
jgi:serine phosphatase RsbU (regulator of sigma subunit)